MDRCNKRKDAILEAYQGAWHKVLNQRLPLAQRLCMWSNLQIVFHPGESLGMVRLGPCQISIEISTLHTLHSRLKCVFHIRTKQRTKLTAGSQTQLVILMYYIKLIPQVHRMLLLEFVATLQAAEVRKHTAQDT